MPVTLRKRPAPAEPPTPAPPAKKKSAVAKTVAKVKETVSKAAPAPKTTKAAPAPKTNGSKAKAAPVAKAEAKAPTPEKETVEEKEKVEKAKTGPVVVGETIELEGFGGEIETNEGEKTSLKNLVDASKNGVVIFTYPKASTPGCTTQVCAFRDSHASLQHTGYTIYGLSKDSPKANTSFKTKQKLQYTLLCDVKLSLIEAIGLKKGNSTTRGVFIVDKSGKVLAAQAGSPKGTLEVVERLLVAEEEEGEGEVGVGEEKDGAAPEEKEEVNEEAKLEGKEEKTEEKPPAAEETAPETNGVETNGTNGSSAAEKEDIAKANVAADVADTAEKLDGNGKDSEAPVAEASA